MAKTSASSTNKSSKNILALFLPQVAERIERLENERDEAQRLYIACERRLSRVSPTSPFAITDEMIDRRMEGYK